MSKVIIGIVAKHNGEIKKRPDTYIRDEVKQAIFDNGAIAIGILPPEKKIKLCGNDWKDTLTEKEREDLLEQISLCDGIIIQGGTQNDEYENIIAKYCYDNNIPILGICAGQNIIVRALGGTTTKVTNPEKHNNINDDYVHSIKINKNSRFYTIIQKNEIMVNSRHNNTVEKCPLLNKVAFCEDGYADVVESEDKDFYIGVRFHPESLYKIDENHNRIFKEFIKSCKNRNNAKIFYQKQDIKK